MPIVSHVSVYVLIVHHPVSLSPVTLTLSTGNDYSGTLSFVLPPALFLVEIKNSLICCRFYPQHYAPYLSDVKNFSDMKMEFDLATPFMPFEQLMAVLPAASKNLLPVPFQVSGSKIT